MINQRCGDILKFDAAVVYANTEIMQLCVHLYLYLYLCIGFCICVFVFVLCICMCVQAQRSGSCSSI